MLDKDSKKRLTLTDFLKRGGHYSAPGKQSKSRLLHFCLFLHLSFMCSYCCVSSRGCSPPSCLSLYSTFFLSSHYSSSASSLFSPHSSNLSSSLTLPLSKRIAISHYQTQKLYAWGWERSSVGMKENLLR